MNSLEYLATQSAKGFSKWLSHYLCGKPFNHSCSHKRPKLEWKCSSLSEAAKAYIWNGNDLASTNEKLGNYAERLRKAIADEDNNAAISVASEIQRWGGTDKGRMIDGIVVTGNLAALRTYGPSFVGYLKECAIKFNSDDSKRLSLKHGELRSNAGFTKIYALAFDNFCIYDSRVAASLGLLVRKYCEETALSEVPAELAFAMMAERGSSQRRDASNSQFKFPKAQSDGIHYRWNMRANWLLNHSLMETAFAKEHHSSPLRALEAALFMIGYDITDNAL